MSRLFTLWPTYWNFSFSISPPSDSSGLISFRIDWFDLLAIQGTLKSLLQHHNSKASIFGYSAFFTVQFSHPCVTTGKITALTIQNFVGKVMSLPFNTLSSLVIPFLPRKRRLLISGPQSVSRPSKNDKRVSRVGENRKEFGRGILVSGKEVRISEKP